MTARCALGACWVALVLWAPPLAAQASDGGRFELGAFALYTRYDPDGLAWGSSVGAGARAGWFVSRVFSVEAAASQALARQTTEPVEAAVSELAATALATARVGGSNQVFLGLGYSRMAHSGESPFTDNAAHAVLGDRIPISRMAALRLEGRAVYTPRSNAPTAAGGSTLNLSAAAGVSVFLGARPPRDEDGDLVPDRHDACPESPGGAIVDARGCPRDSDSDGIYDGRDRCPGTPQGAPTDAAGCPLDSDGDGAPDFRDRCPDTPGGVVVGDDGCPLDADGDDVPDSQDQCPDTPSGAAVTEDGCPRDSDADGIADYADRCPDTSPGQRVDGVGCAVLFVEDAGEVQPLVLKGVTFDLNQATLTPASHAILDEVAASLLVHTDVRIEIAGHTDNSGTRQRNTELSLARAEAVRAYLIARGVALDRLAARGYGPDVPVASNGTEAGRAQNRRVELRLIVN
jgi:outer membrane protein OmpA-like peptidoglycan-associated protein